MRRLNQWSNLNLRSKGLVVIAFPAAATVAIACAAYWIGSLAERAELAVNHTIGVLQATEELQASEEGVSTAARGYFITRDDMFAARLRESIASFDTARLRLTALAEADPVEQRRLAEIDAIQRSRVERNFALIASVKSGALPAAALAEALRAAEGDRLDLEKRIGEVLETEQRALEARMKRVDALRARLRSIIGICALFGIAGGLVISLLFAAGITSRITMLKENVRKLASGCALDPGPDGEDEIGQLNVGIVRTAEILRQKTLALENALQGIAVADASGRYRSFNKAYGELFGITRIHECDVKSSVHPEDRAAIEQALSRMREEGRAEAEARIARSSGSPAAVSMIFLPATSDRQGDFQIFVRDISEQKEAQAALIRAKDAAVASNRAKTEFLAKISHDIRTPLNAILGAADLLSQTRLEPDQHEYVTMFQRNCRRLVSLINDFLDFSRIEAGAVRVERVPFRIRQIVDDAVRTFHETALRKRIELAVEVSQHAPEWIMGDPLRLQQVLANLLSNALKFTPEGQVTVRIGLSTDGGQKAVRFEVTDSGPGIAAADLELIFAPFQQLDNQKATPIRGSGLGLTISRELVQLMDGHIGVDSKVGSGSTFFFTVPFDECTAPNPVTASEAESRPGGRLRSGAPMRILIAEDTEDNCVLLDHYLRDQPVTVEFAHTGQEAVEAVQRREFHLILMDIDMPVMDGRTATRRIREWQLESGCRPTPIVALSADAIHEQVRACLEAGCVAHVAKPVDQATLIDTIARYARGDVAAASRSPVNKAVAKLVPGYLASKAAQIEEAFAQLTERNYESIKRFGHNLKGTGRGYGFPEIEDLGRGLENAAAREDENGIAGSLLALHRFVNRVTEGCTEPTACGGA